MTSQGHTYARFQRALATGNPWIAAAAARELHTMSLEDALRLCLVFRGDPDRYERAAARWLARYAAETRGARLADIEVLAGLLRGAGDADRGACAALAAWALERKWRVVAAALDHL